jgi:hypothetical protein
MSVLIGVQDEGEEIRGGKDNPGTRSRSIEAERSSK